MDGQEAARRMAGRNVRRAMGKHSPPYNPASLARAAGLGDASTVRDLLNATRMPRFETCAKLDAALDLEPGTIWAWLTDDAEFFADQSAGDQLREQRESRGLTRRELAELVQIGSGSLADMEHGRADIPANVKRRLVVLFDDDDLEDLVAEMMRRRIANRH